MVHCCDGSSPPAVAGGPGCRLHVGKLLTSARRSVHPALPPGSQAPSVLQELVLGNPPSMHRRSCQEEDRALQQRHGERGREDREVGGVGAWGAEGELPKILV